MLIIKIAAMVLAGGLLVLTLKKEQPAYSFLVSVCGAGAVLVLTFRQVEPVLRLIETLTAYTAFPGGQSFGCVLQVLGISLVAQLAADLCRESGMSAAAGAVELCGRMLAMLQALPLLQSLVGSLSSFLC
nr:stage III sporulation AC/AD family protein [uncultured Gemmiger sp.]